MRLREIRDAGFAELERRHQERLNDRTPACWTWVPDSLEATDDEHGLRLAFRSWHAGRCAVCGWKATRLVDDHDHHTGLVRGLLCRSCNAREPHDDGLFQKYRERPPAQILGVQMRYYDPWRGWAEPRVSAPRQLDDHPAYSLAAKLAARLQPEDG